MKTPPLAVVYRKTADLKPDPRNARTHSPEQVEQLRASYRQFGFTNPILLRESGMVGAGHGRLLMAQAEGLAEVPTITLHGLSDDQWRAYALADNKLALNAGWDEGLLREELAAIADGFPDLVVDLGFGADELEALLNPGQVNERDADDVPDAPVVPITQPGDVWRLGKHRAMCGDSTSAEAVAVLMAGQEAALCFTSPPYGQQRDYGAAKEQTREWDRLMQGVFSVLPLTRAAQVLVNLGMIHRDNEWIPYWSDWVEWMRAQGWRRFGWYVWDQGFGLPGDWNGRLAPSHEFVFHFNREAQRARKTKAKNPDSVKQLSASNTMRGKDGQVREFSSPDAGLNTHKIPDSVIRVLRHQGGIGKAGSHPAVFSVAFAEEVVAAFSDPGALIYEPFTGSGSQIVAAEKIGRRCYGMELDPVYVDVAVRRWEMFTGQEATLEATGQTFREVADERIRGNDTPTDAAPVSDSTIESP
jgi:DNA modification methylase